MKKIAMLALVAFTFNAMAEEAEQEVAQVETAETSPFDGLFVGAGIGGNFLKHKADGYKDMKVNRFAGDIFFGYGKTFNNVYVAGEALLEFSQAKTKDIEKSDGTKTGKKIKTQMFTPELTLKLGYVYCNNMFYAKAGIARPTAKTENSAKNKSIVKITPVIYAGVARAFGNWAANVEAGYQFRQSKDSVKANEGWKVRAGISRAFNLF